MRQMQRATSHNKPDRLETTVASKKDQRAAVITSNVSSNRYTTELKPVRLKLPAMRPYMKAVMGVPLLCKTGSCARETPHFIIVE